MPASKRRSHDRPLSRNYADRCAFSFKLILRNAAAALALREWAAIYDTIRRRYFTVNLRYFDDIDH